MGTSDWRAGHMGHAASTLKRLKPYLGAVLEVVDARAPEATRYPGLGAWLGTCPRLLVMNKADVADPAATAAWQQHWLAAAQPAVAVVALAPAARGHVLSALEDVRRMAKSRRVAVIGLPNLGKSTLLNRMVGQHRLRTGNRPGVTRGPQWILADGWEWLDLPGVLANAQARDWRLKALGAVGTDPEEWEDLAGKILQGGEAALDAFGRARGFLARGGEVDRHRAAAAVMADFQRGALGRRTLESPPGALDGRE